jgi:hypothetical protein
MKTFRWIAGVVIVLCFLPVAAFATAAALSGPFGCAMTEAGPQRCLVLGIDIGGLIYALAVSGWLALATLPVAALIAVVWLAMELARRGRPAT